MDEATFEMKLNELVSEIGAIPSPQRQKLIQLAQQTRDCHKQLKHSVDRLQESLDYLRVSIKYLLFDLEATRRENNYLRRIIEESG
jgi:uncharacterized protein YfbU (UPF0304 family)